MLRIILNKTLAKDGDAQDNRDKAREEVVLLLVL